MKNSPVVLPMSHLGKRRRAPLCHGSAALGGVWLVLGLLSSSCSAENGELFPELSPSAASSLPEGGSSSPEPAEDVPREIAAPTPDPEAPELPEIDLPLGGQLPVPPRPSEAPPAVPEGPVVLSVSPANGAVGVANEASIIITFSEPMDRVSTEAAYQSESIPSGSVRFEWSDDDTVVRIVPSTPPAYGTGPDRARAAARRVAYFLSASAQSQGGAPLARPYEFSYSLLRQVELSISAVQDRDLSGSFRSNDTYGAGQCAREEINMCVGDVRVRGESEEYRGFMSFVMAELPADATDVRAELRLEITGMSGNPFGNLGGLVLEHLRFDAIGADAFGVGALEELGLIASDGDTGSVLGADVSAALLTDGPGALSQYRLRFEDAPDGDGDSDAIRSAWDTQRLDVSYLVP